MTSFLINRDLFSSYKESEAKRFGLFVCLSFKTDKAKIGVTIIRSALAIQDYWDLNSEKLPHEEKSKLRHHPVKNIKMKTQERRGRYIRLVERIYQENNKPMRYKGTIESMLYELFAKTSKKRYLWKRNTFKRLLIHLYDQKRYAFLRKYHWVAALHNMSAFGNMMVRPVEEWRNESDIEEDQLKSLVRHCFALYETPEFLELSFYIGNKKHMLWYVQLGKGKSVKDLSDMPIDLTGKMAHTFRHAPAYLGVNGALRYAQSIGFGASTKTAKMIACSRLSAMREGQESFWATAVWFFSKQEDLHVNELDGIVDYLAFKYRENRAFSMKGRTYKALLNQSEEWHRQVYLKEKGAVFSWSSSGIKPLYFEEVVNNKKVVYTTEELLSSEALFDEGQSMQHCVSEYDGDCDEGRCSIFSLRQEIEGEPIKRLATLEIELPSYEIAQAKSKCNEDLDKKSAELVDLWVSNSQVKRKTYELSYQPQGQQGAHARLVQRRQMAQNDEQGWILLIKLILWILYVIFRGMSAS